MKKLSNFKKIKKKMKMKLPNKDKLLHFICGTYIYLIASVLLTPMLSILLVIIAGFAKEFIWDRWLNKGTFEWMDIVYTELGGVSVIIASLIINLIKRIVL